jgi:hypothetical protein
MKSACMTKQEAGKQVRTNVFTAQTRTTCDGSLGGLLQNELTPSRVRDEPRAFRKATLRDRPLNSENQAFD